MSLHPVLRTPVEASQTEHVLQLMPAAGLQLHLQLYPARRQHMQHLLSFAGQVRPAACASCQPLQLHLIDQRTSLVTKIAHHFWLVQL